MRENYWSKFTSQRVGRRRALAATGATAAAAALLAACGGGSEDESDKSSLVVQPVDTLKVAKRGGILKDRMHAEPPTLDVLVLNQPWTVPGLSVYNQLVQDEAGHLRPRQAGIVAPELAESWEYSPDGLQITLKIRQGVKFHNKAPLNGRGMTMDDVIFSWDRFSSKSSNRGAVANAANPEAPVVSLTATDSRTIAIKLKEPFVYALNLFNSTSGTGMYIIPKETDSTLDLRGDMLGTGAWSLANYTPSVGFTLKRNAEFWDKDWALVDQVDLPIIPEAASALSQLKAGNIYSMGSFTLSGQLNPEDVLPLKREQSELAVYQSELRSPGGVTTFSFGWLPEGKSPFLDERVRQAVSMSWERDLFQDTFLNVSGFRAEGVPVESRWNTAITGSNDGWWLDPQVKDFGPNAKYYQHNIAEAKKLLAAAGYPEGFETVSNHITGPELGQTPKLAAVLDGFSSEIGIKSRINSLDYQKEYGPLFRDGRGQYTGWSYASGAGQITFDGFWSKNARAFRGFSVTGRNDQSGDPQVDAMIEKLRIEQDVEKRKALAFDLQRSLAKSTYLLQLPGVATGLTVAWPCLGNFGVWQGGRPNYGLWVDETKPPFRSS